MPPVARRALLVLGAAVLASGCGDDGDAPRRDATGCPVAVGYVTELLGFEVEVDDDDASELACRYVPVDAGDRPGTHVLIVERDVADDGGYDTLLTGVQAEASVVEVLEGDDAAELIEGAERAWVAQVGRVVQVAASTGDAVFQVTVADADRTAEEATEVAVALAADAIR